MPKKYLFFGLLLFVGVLFQIACNSENDCEFSCETKGKNIQGYWRKISEEARNRNGIAEEFTFEDGISFDSLNQGWRYLVNNNTSKKIECFEYVGE